mmetsp:Transcript_76506/g.112068  ORF Transcript_76506/g.112068 Transcript_76506/m.112068 type:complete len:207 (-) Transcript_76506:238-858(-)
MPVIKVRVHRRAVGLNIAAKFDYARIGVEGRQRHRFQVFLFLTFTLFARAHVAHDGGTCTRTRLTHSLNIHEDGRMGSRCLAVNGGVASMCRSGGSRSLFINFAKERSEVLLLHWIKSLAHDLEQPVRVRHALDRIGNILHGGRDRHNFLDGGAEALLVVLPVENSANVDRRVDESICMTPFFEIHELCGRIGLEDLARYRAFSHG